MESNINFNIDSNPNAAHSGGKKNLSGISFLLVLFLLFGIAGVFTGSSLSAKKSLRKQLPEKYRNWMDLVEYIITGEEQATFLRLSNDRDRDVFISLFWNLRDPSPGTEENEFKIEHERRFKYANRYYKYSSPRVGWKTDRGKIYIIMGEPNSISRYEMDSVTRPAIIWNYYGDKRIGLPSAFRIIFFQEHGMGEYKIYDPSVNTPGQLVRKSKETHSIDTMDIRANYEALREEHPELAKASLSLIPDEANYDYMPSLRSRELLNNVIQYPQNRINDSYATNFLKYKGKVEVDYSINYVESAHRSMIVKDPQTGLNFVHFAIRPKEISAQATGDKDTFFFNFMMNVSLYKDNQPVFEYRKNFPYNGKRDELLKNFMNSLVISDSFPVPEGKYRLSVLLQNTVNKEFTFFDDTIDISSVPPEKPVIAGLMLSGEVRSLQRQVFMPFKFRELEVSPNPAKEFGTQDKVTAVFALNRGKYAKNVKGALVVSHLTDDKKFRKEYPFDLGADTNLNVPFITRSQRLEGMPPGYYNLKLKLTADDGTTLAEKVERFTISFKKHVPGTTHLFKSISGGNKFLQYHILGLQYMRMQQFEDAERYLGLALSMRPGYSRLVKDLCSLLIKRKKFDRVLTIVEGLKKNEKDKFDYHAFKGKAQFFKGLYSEALTNLAEANSIYDSDISVLNYLGFAYLKTGNKVEAKKVFNASLRLNAQQKNIQAVLKEI